MPASGSHSDPAHRDRFLWQQDEFDEALELGNQLVHKLTTGDGEDIEISRLEHGGARVSIRTATARAELTLTTEEAHQVGSALQDSRSTDS